MPNEKSKDNYKLRHSYLITGITSLSINTFNNKVFENNRDECSTVSGSAVGIFLGKINKNGNLRFRLDHILLGDVERILNINEQRIFNFPENRVSKYISEKSLDNVTYDDLKCYNCKHITECCSVAINIYSGCKYYVKEITAKSIIYRNIYKKLGIKV